MITILNSKYAVIVNGKETQIKTNITNGKKNNLVQMLLIEMLQKYSISLCMHSPICYFPHLL